MGNETDLITGYNRLQAENVMLRAALDAAAKQNTELMDALVGLADEYVDRRCQFGHEYLWTKHEVLTTVNTAFKMIERHRTESAEGEE